MELAEGHVAESGHQHRRAGAPLPTLLELERTIQSRREAAEAAQGAKRDWSGEYLQLILKSCS